MAAFAASQLSENVILSGVEGNVILSPVILSLSKDEGRREAFMALKAELSGRPSLSPQPVEGTVATTIPELDRLLAGGFPSGSVATLEGATGRWSVAAGLVSAMTRRSLVAILDDGALYPPALPTRAPASSEFSSFPSAKRSRSLAQPIFYCARGYAA